MAVRVLICDDAVMYATLLSFWLKDDPEITVVGQVSSAEEALDRLDALNPDVILLDHMLPDGMSSDLVPRFRDRAPQVGIVLVSGLPERELTKAAEAVNASASVTKSASQDRVRSAILRGAMSAGT